MNNNFNIDIVFIANDIALALKEVGAMSGDEYEEFYNEIIFEGFFDIYQQFFIL